MSRTHSLGYVVGFLVCVELASGVLQGYYTPLYPDLARHLHVADGDVNWLEAAQLIVSALVVPPLARLADIVGHRRVLLGATVVTAVASWGLVAAPGFATFLGAWAVQGVYVVWLPLEIAIIHRRTGGDGLGTRRAAGILVGFLYVAIIVGAGLSGALDGVIGMRGLLAVPAAAVTLVIVAIVRGVEDAPGSAPGRFDWPGLGLLTLALGVAMSGLVVLRVQGIGSVPAWLLVVLGVALLVPWWRVELRTPEPLVDVRLLGSAAQWPLQLTAALVGMSVLGAQIPLSTYARTNASRVGYGLSTSAGFVSVLIAVYVVVMAASAFLLPLTTRRLGEPGALITGCLLIAVGYAAWLPLHAHAWQGLVNMAVVGAGTGMLIAALPAAAAVAAPSHRTAMASGLTNATKTVGGAVASAIFAIALSATGTIADPDPAKVHAPLSGYLTVWSVCAASALLAAGTLAWWASSTGSGSSR